MAIGVIMDYEGSLELYDEASERLNTRDNPPDGLIFHWAAQLDDLPHPDRQYVGISAGFRPMVRQD